MTINYESLQEQFPFLTYGIYLEDDYIGIVQNCDQQILSLYVYNHISEDRLRKLFLNYGDIWWWESNRMVPINVFLKEKFKVFKPYLKTFVRKEFNIQWGPVVSLQDSMIRRIKRRQITLIKKFPN